MQINVLEYFERGALAAQRQKAAVIDRGRSYTFEDIARCAKNCAALILERTQRLNRPIAAFLPKSAETIVADLNRRYSVLRQLLRELGYQIAAGTPQGNSPEPRSRAHHHDRRARRRSSQAGGDRQPAAVHRVRDGAARHPVRRRWRCAGASRSRHRHGSALHHSHLRFHRRPQGRGIESSKHHRLHGLGVLAFGARWRRNHRQPIAVLLRHIHARAVPVPRQRCHARHHSGAERDLSPQRSWSSSRPKP